MVKGYYRELVAVLKANGCWFVRHGKGDHDIWYSPITEIHVTVDHGCKSRHTANNALKQAGIKEKL